MPSTGRGRRDRCASTHRCDLHRTFTRRTPLQASGAPRLTVVTTSGAPTPSGPTPNGPTPNVLIVEDEHVIADAVAARLESEGLATTTVYDGVSAVERARELQPDLVVLDVMLPGLDGIEVCRQIQAERPVPVLMVTARDDETDVLIGLGVGADDYLTKPFSMRELVARVRALLRRVERAAELHQSSRAPQTLGALRLEPDQRRVWVGGDEVHLTPTEFDLLARLAAEPGTVIRREDLLADVWGWADASGTRTVDSHLKALRKKLGADLFRTVHGVGYALEHEPS